MMIKGVHKQIIEINEPFCKYFDRAILFVSTDYQNRPVAEIRSYARQYLAGIGAPKHLSRIQRKRRQNLKATLLTLGASAIAIAVTLLLLR